MEIHVRKLFYGFHNRLASPQFTGMQVETEPNNFHTCLHQNEPSVSICNLPIRS